MNDMEALRWYETRTNNGRTKEGGRSGIEITSSGVNGDTPA